MDPKKEKKIKSYSDKTFKSIKDEDFSTDDVKYCIFEVSDYKGGELHSSINLSKKSLLGNLMSQFENAFYDEEDEFDYSNKILIKETILKTLNDPDFFGTYAGGGGFCGKVYKVQASTLTAISFKSLVDDLTEYAFNKWGKK